MENTENTKPQSGLIILSQYIKDMSIEIPLAPEIFKEINTTPDVKVDISMKNRHLEDGTYEVMLSTKLNAEVNNKKLFIIELSYGAVAAINLPEDTIEPILNIELPRLIFPFARSIIANSLSAAGLPPIMISPIDFLALYQAKKSQEAKSQTKEKA